MGDRAKRGRREAADELNLLRELDRDEDPGRLARALLWWVDGIGPVRYRKLLDVMETGRAALSAGPARCAAVLGRADLAAKLWASWPDAAVAVALRRDLTRPEIFLLERGEATFPSRLAALDEPEWLYVRGDLLSLEQPLASVVGTRAARPDGIRLTRRIVRWCADRGWDTVSGGALGVDAEAHRASLDLKLRTVVVLPAGVSHLAPRSHVPLFNRVCAEGGCLVSEHPPWRRPLRKHFVRRNRLISGLGEFTIVVRAPVKSGALITVKWAHKQGRAVYAVPGAPDDPTSAGCLDALRNGAHLLARPDDLPEAASAGHRDMFLGVAVVPHDEGLLSLLRRGPMNLDELIRLTGESPARLLARVTRLTLQGAIETVAPGQYAIS